MKRRLFKLVIFLLLGAVATVGVAWGYALWSSLPPYDWRNAEVGIPSDLAQLIPEHWQRPTSPRAIRFMESYDVEASFWVHIRTERATGVGVELTAVRFHKYVPGVLTMGPNHALLRHKAGWPCRALAAVCLAESWRRDPIDGEWNGAIDAPSSLRPIQQDRFPFKTYMHPLPLTPLFPGVLINALFYAAILWTLWSAPFAARRLIRKRRGRCVRCGYDLRHVEHDVCPECGA